MGNRAVAPAAMFQPAMVPSSVAKRNVAAAPLLSMKALGNELNTCPVGVEVFPAAAGAMVSSVGPVIGPVIGPVPSIGPFGVVSSPTGGVVVSSPGGGVVSVGGVVVVVAGAGMVTAGMVFSVIVAPVIESTLASPVPFSEIHSGLVGDIDTPHGFTRLG